MNIYDIAKKSGVSIATVSRVLNDSDSVKQITKEKVISVIKEENYRPNAFARGLSAHSIKLIGVVCTDVSDAFFAKAVSILQGLLRELGYSVILCCTGESKEEMKSQLDYMLEKNIDAIFLIGSTFCDDNFAENIFSAAAKAPTFMINAKIDGENIYSVYSDEEASVSDTVNKLITSGKKNILYVYDALTPSAIAKLSGYVKGITQNNIEYNEELVVKAAKTIEGGKTAVKTAIKNGNVPDAVICAEDILAIGALKEMQKNKIKPCVIGFNNSFLCECASPTLSSIDNRLYDMCKTAVDVMIKVLNGEKVDKKYKLSAELILRESFKGEKQSGNNK